MSDDRYAGLKTLDLEPPVWDRCVHGRPARARRHDRARRRPRPRPEAHGDSARLGQLLRFRLHAEPCHVPQRRAHPKLHRDLSAPRGHRRDEPDGNTALREHQARHRCARDVPATEAEGVFARNGYLFLECVLERIVEGFGRNALIAGRIVAAHIDPVGALRSSDRDDADILLAAPQLAYLYPGRFSVIDTTHAFPFPAGMRH